MDIDVFALDAAAEESSFSGLVTVHQGGELAFEKAWGMADRAHGVPNTGATRFSLASGAKSFTALAVMRLVEDGVLALDAPVRRWLGEDLPLIDDAVTLEQLLTHTSGMEDYLDESAGGAITDYAMTVPVHRLDSTEAYLPALEGHPHMSAPGQHFAYNNSGYVVAALVAERAAGLAFPGLVQREVFGRAGMMETAYLRMDELHGDVARGYLFEGGLRTNVLHLPVRGSGDGGAFSSAGDLARFWGALFAGRIVTAETLTAMIRPRVDVPDEGKRYGMGFWLAGLGHMPAQPAVIIEGYDAGVSMRSTCDPVTGEVATVLSNWSDGAWAVGEVVDGWLVA